MCSRLPDNHFNSRDEYKIYKLNKAFVRAVATDECLDFRTLGEYVAELDVCV